MFFGGTARSGPDRKTLQLCKQAQRALALALGSACGDEILRDVYVDTVSPEPDASRLRVTVRPVTRQVDPGVVLDRLLAKRGALRSAVAASISRKRAPELAFCVAAPGDEP